MARSPEAEHQRLQLHHAASEGDLAAVERLLAAQYPVNRFDELGNTPLHYAVINEHLEVVDRLLRAGANVNAHDERCIGNTPLGEHAAKCSVAMAKRLIDAGADPLIPGWMRITALDTARARKSTVGREVAQLLEAHAKRRR